MSERDGVLDRMKKIEGYFQWNSIDNHLFIPELECARMIREKIEHVDQLTLPLAEKILALYNTTNSGEHYKGSGWEGYQMHLMHLLSVDGFKVDLDRWVEE